MTARTLLSRERESRAPVTAPVRVASCFRLSQGLAHAREHMLREYVRVHRIDAVAPERKCAFPHEAGNNVLLGLLSAPRAGLCVPSGVGCVRVAPTRS